MQNKLGCTAGAICETTKADIVMLVDTSPSVSPDDFASVEMFLTEIVKNVHIDPNGVQIGLTWYSYLPKSKWDLNTYKNKLSLLMAQEITTVAWKAHETDQHFIDFTADPYHEVLWDFSPCQGSRGAGALWQSMGKALAHILHHSFKPSVGIHAENKKMLFQSLQKDQKRLDSKKYFRSLHMIIDRLTLSPCHNAPRHPLKLQLSLNQYSGRPQTEWDLNTYKTKQSLLEAIEKIKKNRQSRQRRTNTGIALHHILHRSFKPTVGMRPDSKKIAVLITDGQSHDHIKPAAKNLKDTGIEIYIIGD
ncbi:PREDICTED: collagen alpha-1(XII) chain-like [Cyprinodon variegatus]|uniref:collagen alpha-1(XII) chain-like n=1 Tax=Cyprinodon variegatus TaxID=28743 RepID=UPI000742C375|nr:PREDICTED: collagen alpha-1(XII) chain-like [Cyprinodon variegatus]